MKKGKPDVPLGYGAWKDLFDAAGELRVGGERKYGFGRIKFDPAESAAVREDAEFRMNGLGAFRISAGLLTAKKESPLPFHTPQSEKTAKFVGRLERQVARIYDSSGGKGFGRKLEKVHDDGFLFFAPAPMARMTSVLR